MQNSLPLFHKFFYYCLFAFSVYRAIHYSAKRGIAIVCRPSIRLSVPPSVRPSVCNVGGSEPHRMEILETNCTDS